MKSTRRHSSLGISRPPPPPSSQPAPPLPIPPSSFPQTPSNPPPPPRSYQNSGGPGPGAGSSADAGASTSSHHGMASRHHDPHRQNPPRPPGSNPAAASALRHPDRAQSTDRSRYWSTVLDGDSGQPGLTATTSFHRAPQSRPPPTPPFSPISSLSPSRSAGSSSNTNAAQQQHPPPRGASSSKKKLLKCPHCSEQFERRFDMRAHIAHAHKAKAVLQGYPCKDANCDKVFGHRSSRCRHEKQAHGSGQN